MNKGPARDQSLKAPGTRPQRLQDADRLISQLAASFPGLPHPLQLGLQFRSPHIVPHHLTAGID